MYTKLICVVLVTVFLLESTQGKRTRKNKYVNNETQDSTPQPSVLTYSTFGFNDVGSYDGFLPSSPDYANYFNHNREPSTRLYAPAFPSAADSNFGSNNGPHTEEQNTMNNFQPPSTNFFTSPSADYKGQSAAVNEGVYGQNTDDALAYGAKLSSRPKTKVIDNNTGINIYGSISSITELEASNEKNSLGANTQSYPDTKITPSHSNNIQQNMFRHSFQSPYKENESFEKPTSTTSPSVLKFPKVIDFTKYKPNYPTSMDNKYVDMTQKPFNIDALVSGDDNSNVNTYSQPLSNQYQPKYDYKDTPSANEGAKYNTYHYQDTPDNSIHIGQGIKHNKDNGEYKDKVKSKPWNVNSEERKKYRNMKGYEYSTNQSSTSFKYDYGPPKSDFNNSADEIAPASSNHGFTSYQLPENQYSELGKTPSIKSPFIFDNNKGLSFYQEKPVEELFYHEKPVEEPNYEYKTSYTTLPTISSNWGNIFKTSDYSVHKTHSWKPQTSEDSDIIHIPKKHENQKYFKQFESNPNEWLFSSNFRPSKSNYKPQIDWNENLSNKYKSEEDLLGLRTHDTLQPNNLPNYKPSYNDFDEEIDYRKLVEKWRQNYIRSKQKDSLREYESYASDSKPVQVSRPYPIEVPNPVIVPVPQPYPVKVPIPKPVAVPVIRELTVPVEKPVLYPVVKKVPYPVEKPVPVPVVKQVRVPVMKPYPVAIPQIKPVFHHTKPHDDEPEDDDEYVPRPEKKPYNKKAKNHRSRPRPTPSRRPSRMTYQDRNKRRPPSRPTSSSSSSEHRYRRPTTRDHRPHRYHDDFEDYDHEASDYIRYCKRTGNC